MYQAFYFYKDAFCYRLLVCKEGAQKAALGTVALAQHRIGIKEVTNRCLEIHTLGSPEAITDYEFEMYTGETMEEFYNKAARAQDQLDIIDGEH